MLKILKKNRLTLLVSIFILTALFRGNYKPDVISKVENRKLVKWPVGSLDEKYISQLHNYFRDRIGLRNISLKLYPTLLKYVFHEMENKSLSLGKEGAVFSKFHRVAVKEDFIENYAAFLRASQDYLNTKGIKFLLYVVPSKNMTFPELHPTWLVDYDTGYRNFIRQLNAQGVNYLDIQQAFLKDSNKHLYFNYYYDSNHWNDEGALVGFNLLLSAMQKDYPEISLISRDRFSEKKHVVYNVTFGYYPIEEEIIKLVDENLPIRNDKLLEEIEISPQFSTKAQYQTGVETLPNVLNFSGSYTNSRKEMLSKSFNQYTLIHNYHNFLNMPYYVNIFKPDYVILETVDYVLKDAYFNTKEMQKITFNPSLPLFENAMLLNADIEIKTESYDEYQTVSYYGKANVDLKYIYLTSGGLVFDGFVDDNKTDFSITLLKSDLFSDAKLVLITDDGKKIVKEVK